MRNQHFKQGKFLHKPPCLIHLRHTDNLFFFFKFRGYSVGSKERLFKKIVRYWDFCIREWICEIHTVLPSYQPSNTSEQKNPLKLATEINDLFFLFHHLISEWTLFVCELLSKNKTFGSDYITVLNLNIFFHFCLLTTIVKLYLGAVSFNNIFATLENREQEKRKWMWLWQVCKCNMTQLIFTTTILFLYLKINVMMTRIHLNFFRRSSSFWSF